MAFDYAVVLTGSIATGKSTVVNFFKEDGFTIIDADKIAHSMLDLHQDKIVELFGAEYIIDNRVNRKALGELIFGNLEEKLRLEKLLHPLIFSEIEYLSQEEDKLKIPYIIDIPLFFENEGRYPIKKSIVVYTPQTLQLERLMLRDHSTQKLAQQRINSQLNIEKKKQLASYLIDNSKDFSTLKREYDRVKHKILYHFFKDNS